MELSIIMPCLNEAETLEICIKKAKKFLLDHKVEGEIIIGDNGSTDGSIEIATRNGAKVVNVREKGYGAALMGGIEAAKGKYVIMGDSDDSYDFLNLFPFLEKLREGYSLVMGNRFKGGIKKGAMPFLHRYLGNPVLSFIGKLFFEIKVNDFHCGLRGFSKSAYKQMNLNTPGMEFASAMVVKSSLLNMKMIEVPTTLSPDGRTRPPHLRTWRDGWRHLRFLLLYSPKWLFFYPGMVLMVLGTITSAFLYKGPISFNGVIFDVHTFLYTTFMVLIGFELVFFYLFSKTYAINKGLLPSNNFFERVNSIFTLEKGLIVGILLLILGGGMSLSSLLGWAGQDFGPINSTDYLRTVIPSILFVLLGVQTVLYSFFYSILNLK